MQKKTHKQTYQQTHKRSYLVPQFLHLVGLGFQFETDGFLQFRNFLSAGFTQHHVVGFLLVQLTLYFLRGKGWVRSRYYKILVDIINSINIENENSNLLIGDVISEVNRETISNTNSFANLVDELKETGRSSLLLKVIRDDEQLWLTIKFNN